MAESDVEAIVPRPEDERTVRVKVHARPDRRMLVDEAGDGGGLRLGKGVRAAVGVTARRGRRPGGA